MRVAIMQPYFFPYVGYFQLINSVDKFVIYDDVNFIKQGWINRNNILIQGNAYMFTVPLSNQSSFLKINEVTVNHKLFGIWKSKFMKTLNQSYKKAPFYKDASGLVEAVLNQDMLNITIAELAAKSIVETCSYLQIKTTIVPHTSLAYGNSNLNGTDRIIDICRQEKATAYINAIGGQELYDKKVFKKQNLELSFIKSNAISYKQFNHAFVPWLSIIDPLMFNSVEEINIMLDNYTL